MLNAKIIAYMLIAAMGFCIFAPIAVTHASQLDNLLTLAADTASGSNVLSALLSLVCLLYENVIAPILNILDKNSAAPSVGPLALLQKNLADKPLAGKTIAIDPGHGGNNPGAVENGFREADNNLAVSLKLKDRGWCRQERM